MSKEPNRNVYVGHRYVPKIMGEWDKTQDYEGLSIVLYQGTSYTSKKRVPVGIDILNNEFWAVTGNYNAQVDYYRQETERVSEDLLLKSDQTYVDTELGKKADTSFVNTELDKKSDQTYVDTELGKKSDQTYVDTELDKKADKNNVIYVEDFNLIPPENSDSGRIQRAIDEAGTYSVLNFQPGKVYNIIEPVKPRSFQMWNCHGTTFKGNNQNIGVHFEGTADSSVSRITIQGLMLREFDTGIKLSTYQSNGCYYNNFINNRVIESRIGYDLGANSNINNISYNSFQNISETSIIINRGGYKNNVIGSSFEHSRSSTGIISHGSTGFISGNYFENLDVGIDSSEGMSILNSNYFSSSVNTQVNGSNYTLELGSDKSTYYPFLQLGDVRLTTTANEIMLEEMGNTKSRFTIPTLINNTRGGILLSHRQPQIDLRDESDNGGRYRIRSTSGELQVRNMDEMALLRVTNEGIITARKGVNPGHMGTTARPTDVAPGTMIVDSNLQKIIWWNGAYWKDAMGETV